VLLVILALFFLIVHYQLCFSHYRYVVGNALTLLVACHEKLRWHVKTPLGRCPKVLLETSEVPPVNLESSYAYLWEVFNSEETTPYFLIDRLIENASETSFKLDSECHYALYF